VELINLYGPSEACIDTTYWIFPRDREITVLPIGQPIANVQVYLLDQDLLPVPVGVAGELCIGGVCLAQAYHNRPDLTAEKIFPHPFGNPGERLYRTGLAKYLQMEPCIPGQDRFPGCCMVSGLNWKKLKCFAPTSRYKRMS
jgi:non-ribosomal peptide synthetase component F